MTIFKPNVEKLAKRRDVRKLIKCVQHKDWQVKSEAVIALSLIGGDDALEALIAALKHEDSYLRIEVIKALGKLKNKRAIDPLLEAMVAEDWMSEREHWKVTYEDPAKYWYANENNPMERKRHVEVALASIDSNWGTTESVKQAVYSLVKALKSKSYTNRYCAAWALGEIKDSIAIEPLMAALKDANRDVSDEWPFMNALEKIPGSHNVLIPELLHRISTESIDWNAMTVLKREKLDSNAIAPLIKALHLCQDDYFSSSNSIVRKEINEFSYEIYCVLNNIDPHWRTSEIAKHVVPDLIVAVTKEKDNKKKLAAARLLIEDMEINDIRVAMSLIDSLNDSPYSTNVQKVAVLALGKMFVHNLLDSDEVRHCVPSLIKALRSTDATREMRCEIISLLGKIKDPRATDTLIKYIGKREWAADTGDIYSTYVAARAVGALVEIGKPAVEPLLAILKNRGGKSKSYSEMEDAISILAGIKDARALEPLMEVIGISRKGLPGYIYNAAEYALSEITGEHFGQDALKWQDWWEKNKERFLLGSE